MAMSTNTTDAVVAIPEDRPRVAIPEGALEAEVQRYLVERDQAEVTDECAGQEVQAAELAAKLARIQASAALDAFDRSQQLSVEVAKARCADIAAQAAAGHPHDEFEAEVWKALRMLCGGAGACEMTLAGAALSWARARPDFWTQVRATLDGPAPDRFGDVSRLPAAEAERKREGLRDAAVAAREAEREAISRRQAWKPNAHAERVGVEHRARVRELDRRGR